jgi:hypothetical protein
MPGPHNAKKKRGKKKKKSHSSSKTHASTPSLTAHTTHDAVSALSPLVTLLALTAPGVLEAETISPDHSEGVLSRGQDKPSSPVTYYGPTDDPTLILLSNPIIHDPGNGPRVKDMRAFLESSFSQPAWMDDPLCAEFAQREILQMLCTVLPEETALVRPSTSLTRCTNFPISDSHAAFCLSCSACGTTRAAASEGFAPPVFVCTH